MQIFSSGLSHLKFISLVITCCIFISIPSRAQSTITNKKLFYHDIRVDSGHHILPWYSPNLGSSYDHVIHLVWHFWITMRRDYNGLPYYMNHQVWKPKVDDSKGLGGDQLFMAMSSWRLLYQYTGNERVKEDMKFMADYYLTHGMSPANCAWPNIPFPYNTEVYSGIYDGGMILGKGYTQPDKAGSFGIQLVHLYKMTGNKDYLLAAVKIANTLASHVQQGDANHSPLPFKVNVFTGEVGKLVKNGKVIYTADYTTNWSYTLELWQELQELHEGDVKQYQKVFKIVLDWMKKYPIQNNKWGPFFEDITGWSDTQINAATFAFYMMQHRNLFPNWKNQVRSILDWAYNRLGNDNWKAYGVTLVNEQTVDAKPGESHNARQGSTELWYDELTGDMKWKDNAVRELSWATYTVNDDGENRYPYDDIWLTDGYGDYVRHYLRAMAIDPQLAPDDQNHILWTTSIIQDVTYAPDKKTPKKSHVLLHYRTFSKTSTETIRLTQKPTAVWAGKAHLKETSNTSVPGYRWKPLNEGGVLIVHHLNHRNITVRE